MHIDSADRRGRAIQALEAWIASLPGGFRPLADTDLRSYVDRGFTVGWRLNVVFPDCGRALDLLLNDRFPREPPRVAFVKEAKFLTWPHVEKDGVLCVLPAGAQVAANDPIGTTSNILRAACQLIEDSAAGRNENDFREEFLSYWVWAAAEGSPRVYSLIVPGPPTRSIRMWHCREFYVIADDEQTILSWLQHRFGERNTRNRTIEDAVLLWFDRPLIPREFPRYASDVLTLAESRATEGAEILKSVAARRPTKIVAIFGFSTGNGPCFAGFTIPAPRVSTQLGGHAHNPLTRGFRPNKLPKDVLVQRFLNGNPAHRSLVHRVDAAWVHGRGQDPRFGVLRAATVAVLGAGSIGAAVALMLAQAGVGRLVLIDPDRLAWANIGRHPLGAPSVEENKALSLMERIKRDFPHILSVDGYPERWEAVARLPSDVLASSDLIVSAMGDWATEGALNEWHVARARSKPIVYGWTEPHACAGHAVVITSAGGCFQCGFDNVGVPLTRVTDWPAGKTEKQEPACGAVYQPYGPVELSHVVATIAELVLDSILKAPMESRHRIWVARRAVVEDFGGEVTAWGEEIAGDRQHGGCVKERPWAVSASCTECGAGAA